MTLIVTDVMTGNHTPSDAAHIEQQLGETPATQEGDPGEDKLLGDECFLRDLMERQRWTRK